MKMNVIKSFEDLTILANIEMTADVKKVQLLEDVFEYTFILEWNEEQAKDASSKVVLQWRLPCVDVQYMWHPNCRARRVLDGNWRLNLTSMLTGSAPIALLFNEADQNTYTFAVDEVKKVVGVNFGVEDSDNTIDGKISMELNQFIGQNCHTIRVRADLRRVPYYQALDDARAWWEKALDIQPMSVPDVARYPMYSSWYNFHQAISDAELEAECQEAVKLGMKTIIVDDGWQTLDTNCGYGYTGDWQVCKEKISDMHAHVKRVHEIGLKYILWYSVPFVGYYSQNWERFQDKLLYKVDRSSCGVLDPRYPEVREFLIGIYEQAVKEFNLDGFKLDFIDRFVLKDNLEISAEMDYKCVQEATERLMTDISLRLKALKADIMIEFRQKYIGPTMRKYGNIFRVADCASDIATNRSGTIDLRLLSGTTACHGDMLTWSLDETPENGALQILNSMFGVIQFSQIIADMPIAHKKMTKFWLDFASKNRKVLHESKLIPYEPHFLYPVIKAQDEREAIIGVYIGKKVIDVDVSLQKVSVINATKDEVLYLNFLGNSNVHCIIYNTMGEETSNQEKIYEAGIHCLIVPKSGLAEILFK